MNTPLKDIQLEISGKCNAMCPYCITGQKNRKHEETGHFIKPDRFEYAINLLTKKQIINKDTIVSLYNYGEPFLSPYFKEIIQILNCKGMRYGISTNASVLITEDTVRMMTGLTQIQFSVCGTSQNSYDRIYGLSYRFTHSNIENAVHLIHQYIPMAECILKLQMYRFNEDEYNKALAFSVENKMNVIPIHAIFANLQQQMDFIDKYQNGDVDLTASDHLWYYLPTLLSQPPLERCPQWESMVIDEDLNVVLCCMVTKDMPEYLLCNIDNIDKSVLESRLNNEFCRHCLLSKTSRSICLTPSYRKDIYYNAILSGINADDVILVGSGSLLDSFCSMFPKFKKSFTININSLKDNVGKNKMMILADQYWWTVTAELEQQGLCLNKNYVVYNTYLRGIV